MVKKLSLGTLARILVAMPPILRSVAACWRNTRPMKRNEKPKINSPILLRLDLLEKMSGIPMASSGMAKAAISTLKPIAEIIHAVTVVPILAPIMTPMDCAKVIRPALTKLTTITVVADEDCMMAVMRIPVSTPMTRLPVIAARIARSLLPANFSKPSLIIFIP